MRAKTEALRDDVLKKIILPTLPTGLIDDKTKFHINPTGRFVVGGIPRGVRLVEVRSPWYDSIGAVRRTTLSGRDTPPLTPSLPPLTQASIDCTSIRKSSSSARLSEKSATTSRADSRRPTLATSTSWANRLRICRSAATRVRMPGRWILTTTSVTSCRRARCTWAMDAAASGWAGRC